MRPDAGSLYSQAKLPSQLSQPGSFLSPMKPTGWGMLSRMFSWASFAGHEAWVLRFITVVAHISPRPPLLHGGSPRSCDQSPPKHPAWVLCRKETPVHAESTRQVDRAFRQTMKSSSSMSSCTCPYLAQLTTLLAVEENCSKRPQPECTQVHLRVHSCELCPYMYLYTTINI